MKILSKGQRVVVKYDLWYLGTIKSIRNNEINVVFDDDSVDTLEPSYVKPVDFSDKIKKGLTAAQVKLITTKSKVVAPHLTKVQIYNGSLGKAKIAAKSCLVVKYQKTKDRIRAKIVDSEGSQTPHICYVTLAKYPEISCDCENFKYQWEYANWLNGCSKIIHSNGDPAILTNPKNKPGGCKHVLRLIKEMKDRGD